VMWTFRKVVGIALLGMMAVAGLVAGHGNLIMPAPRNTDATTNYNTPGLCAGGPYLVYPAGKTFPNGVHGVCGDPAVGTSAASPSYLRHEGGGGFEKLNGGYRMTYYPQGGTVNIKIFITANHGGYFEFAVCPVPPGVEGVAERKYVTEACFKQNPTPVIGSSVTYLNYNQQPPFTITTSAKLPANLVCARCVFRWHYVTANSCNPPNFPKSWKIDSQMGTCGTNTAANPEEFWNCADIGIVKAGSPVPPPSSNVKYTGINSTSSGPGTTTVTGSGPVAASVSGSTFPIVALIVGVGVGSMAALPATLISIPVGMVVGIVACFIACLITLVVRR